VHERTAEVNRLQKVLEGANIKLAAVASDIMGKSGREMLAGLVAGATDPVALAQLARGRLREKIPHLQQALAGQFAAHQRCASWSPSNWPTSTSWMSALPR
jgi:transposase